MLIWGASRGHPARPQLVRRGAVCVAVSCMRARVLLPRGDSRGHPARPQLARFSALCEPARSSGFVVYARPCYCFGALRADIQHARSSCVEVHSASQLGRVVSSCMRGRARAAASGRFARTSSTSAVPIAELRACCLKIFKDLSYCS